MTMTDVASMAQALLELGAATLGESGGRPMLPRITAVWPGATVAAPAYTAWCVAGDNLAIHTAVVNAPRGAVLVVDASARPELGYWGEVLTTSAEWHGLAGLVIDACVRDVDALERHGFPVFSAGIALPGAQKVTGGSNGRPVNVGGALVETGDWIVGDRDGVCVVPRATVGEVLSRGRSRAAKEAGYFEALRAGATTIDLLGLDRSSVDVAIDTVGG
jgi:4-hydroxy-4-methyl-2-oxoglutarate aldolase